MATEYKLEVQKRDKYGKKASKYLRKNGTIPGIYYSSDSKESISFSIDKTELKMSYDLMVSENTKIFGNWSLVINMH